MQAPDNAEDGKRDVSGTSVQCNGTLRQQCQFWCSQGIIYITGAVMKNSTIKTYCKMITLCIAISSSAHAENETAPASSARIRLFGQNGIGVMFYKNSTCYKSSFLGPYGGESISGGLGNSFSSLIGISSNTSIGIPETETTKKQKEQNGFLSKSYFKEYAIEAGKPLTVFAALNDASGIHCGPLAILFTPESGKDYEEVLEIHPEERICHLIINEIKTDSNNVELIPLTNFSPAKKCP